MAKTRSMTSIQNHDESLSSSKKRFKTFDKDGWSDVSHDVLFLVTMQLGFVDFFAFSGVCKSWRSLALSNRDMFMASTPPMKIRNGYGPNKDDWCSIRDIEGNKFKTLIPHFTGRFCVGSTCGYLILFGRKTHDFWLVNPITRHELHFPKYPINVVDREKAFRGILVFSPSISGWVFTIAGKRKASFTIAGKQGWNHVSSPVPIIDLQVFKGKIYTLHRDCSLGELRISLKHKCEWTLLKTVNSPNPDVFRPLYHLLLVSSGENLYMMTHCGVLPTKVLELDFGETKWVSPEKTMGKYAFFVSTINPSAAINPELWAGPRTPYKSYHDILDDDKNRNRMFYYDSMWYFPHDCLNVNLLNE